MKRLFLTLALITISCTQQMQYQPEDLKVERIKQIPEVVEVWERFLAEEKSFIPQECWTRPNNYSLIWVSDEQMQEIWGDGTWLGLTLPNKEYEHLVFSTLIYINLNPPKPYNNPETKWKILIHEMMHTVGNCSPNNHDLHRGSDWDGLMADDTKYDDFFAGVVAQWGEVEQYSLKDYYQ